MAFSILRFDMRSPGYTPEQRRDLYAAALEMGAWGEAQGFDQITLSEHHATADGYLPAPLALGGAFVGRTQKIRIAIVALLLPLYDPIKLAEELACARLRERRTLRRDARHGLPARGIRDVRQEL